MEWWRQLSADWFGPLDLKRVLVGLALALVMGQVLAWHYVRFAQVLSNKRKFARIFVFIAATTLLLITVVKSSLALSLGLVGALSIIRFRTPIKEPEELAYLFLAIAVGVGLGADQPSQPTALVTVIVFTAILCYLGLRSRAPQGRVPLRTVLQVTAPLRAAAEGGTGDGGAGSGARELEALLPAVQGPCTRVDLRRVDCHGGEVHASLLVELEDQARIGELLDAVQRALPGASVSVVERDGLD